MKKRSILILCIFMSALLLMGNLSVMAEGSIGTIDMSAPGTEIQPYEAVSGMSAGTYYLNSEVTETFLRRSGTGFVLSLYYDSPAIRWIFESNSDGTFLIRSAIQNTYALYGSGTSVQLSLVPDTLTDNYKWKAYTGYNGGILLMNMSNSYYLYCDGSNITLAPKPSYTSSNYSNVVWRVPTESVYVKLESFEVTCNTHLIVGETQNSSISVTPTTATWRNSSNFTWSSSNTAIATVSSSGSILGIGVGMATITVKHKATGTTTSFSVTVEPSYEGTYFIRNPKEGAYMQIDDQKTPNFSDESAIIELWKINGGNEQRWTITTVGNGYYKILSAISGKALSVSSGKENNGEKALIQETYSGVDRQLWKITESARGYYVFKPKSSEPYTTDWVMAAGDTILSSDGLNVEQREYSNDSNVKDEWEMLKCGTDVMMFGVIDKDKADRHSPFDSVMRTLDGTEYEDYNLIVTDYLSIEDCLAQMEEAKIFVASCHGGAKINENGVLVNFIALSGNSDNYSDLSWMHFMQASAPVDFSNMELAVFVACESAYGGTSVNNLITAAVNAGADYAIGFRENIITAAANIWIELFFDYYYTQEYNIFSAALKASTDADTEYTGTGQTRLDSVEVAY